MSRLEQVVRAARRRLLLREVVDRLGVAMCVGAGAGLVLIVAQRLSGVAVEWWMLAAGPMAVAFGWALGAGLVRRESLLGAACHLDAFLGLKDRLSTAVALAGATDAGPFAKAAREDGETSAATVDVRRATPVRIGAAWYGLPLLVAGVIAAGLYLPEWNLLRPGRPASQQVARAAAERTEAADEIRAIREAVAPTAAADPLDDPVVRERLAALEEIEEQLRAGARTAESARLAAARALDEAAQRAARSADTARRSADAVRQSLVAAGRPGPAAPGDGADGSPPGIPEPAAGLIGALRQADLEAARQAAEDLAREARSMSPDERAAAAEAMERYARDLEALRQQEEARRREPGDKATSSAGAKPEEGAATGQARRGDGAGEANKPAVERLQREGLSRDRAERLAAERDAQAIRRELEQQGVDAEQAQRTAEEIARANRERDAQQQAEQEAERLVRNLREAARSLRQGEAGGGEQARGSPDGEPPREDRATSRPPDGASKREPREGEEQAEQPSDRAGNGRRADGAAPSGTPGAQTGESRKVGDQADGRTGREAGPGAEGVGRREGQPMEPRSDGTGAPSPRPQPGRQAPGEQPGADRRDGRVGEGRERTAAGAKPGEQPADGAGAEGRPAPRPGAGRARQAGPEDTSRPAQPRGQMPAGADGGGEQMDQVGEGGERPEPGEGPQAPGAADGMRRLAEQLKELAESSRSAGRRDGVARDLAERARRMYENADPETRREMDRLARALAQHTGHGASGPGDGAGTTGAGMEPGDAGPRPDASAESSGRSEGGVRTEVVDARRREEAERDRARVVAEWLGGGTGQPGADAGAGRERAETALRRAAESAERAVDDRLVHSRYDALLRRYFRRLPENVLPPPTGAPVERAKDAP